MIAKIDGRNMGIDGIIRSLKDLSHLDFPEENRVVKEIVDTIKKRKILPL